MKKNRLLTVALVTVSIVCQAFAVNEAYTVSKEIPTHDNLQAERLQNRLEEIRAMDTKSMSKANQKELQKEVRAIKKQVRELDHGGIYISVGSIIIILLLLILIL